MPIRRTNNFPESGRSLGHVTPYNFGSTVGYPSDILASCHCRPPYGVFHYCVLARSVYVELLTVELTHMTYQHYWKAY